MKKSKVRSVCNRDLGEIAVSYWELCRTGRKIDVAHFRPKADGSIRTMEAVAKGRSVISE
jgi:hypothetical protein